MSLHSYGVSLELARSDPPFSALIMAALRKADTLNYGLLKEAFPAIERELRERYDAPGGMIGAETSGVGMLPREDVVQGEPVITAAGRAVLAARGLEVRDGSLKPSAYERITGKPWVGTDEERARLEGDVAHNEHMQSRPQDCNREAPDRKLAGAIRDVISKYERWTFGSVGSSPHDDEFEADLAAAIEASR